MTHPEAVAVPSAGGPRHYLLYRPEGPNGGLTPPARPAVVLLPGTGGTAAWAADETRLPAFAAAAGFLLAIPEGLPPDPGRPPKFRTNPAAAHGLDAQIKLNDNVIRHLVIRLDPSKK